jgi:hypothetical protein
MDGSGLEMTSESRPYPLLPRSGLVAVVPVNLACSPLACMSIRGCAAEFLLHVSPSGCSTFACVYTKYRLVQVCLQIMLQPGHPHHVHHVISGSSETTHRESAPRTMIRMSALEKKRVAILNFVRFSGSDLGSYTTAGSAACFSFAFDEISVQDPK